MNSFRRSIFLNFFLLREGWEGPEPAIVRRTGPAEGLPNSWTEPPDDPTPNGFLSDAEGPLGGTPKNIIKQYTTAKGTKNCCGWGKRVGAPNDNQYRPQLYCYP